MTLVGGEEDHWHTTLRGEEGKGYNKEEGENGGGDGRERERERERGRQRVEVTGYLLCLL